MRTVVEARAARGAGPTAAGAMGVSFGAAGEFLKRQEALAAERAAKRSGDEPTPKPSLTVVGEGVVVRGGTPGD